MNIKLSPCPTATPTLKGVPIIFRYWKLLTRVVVMAPAVTKAQDRDSDLYGGYGTSTGF